MTPTIRCERRAAGHHGTGRHGLCDLDLDSEGVTASHDEALVLVAIGVVGGAVGVEVQVDRDDVDEVRLWDDVRLVRGGSGRALRNDLDLKPYTRKRGRGSGGGKSSMD